MVDRGAHVRGDPTRSASTRSKAIITRQGVTFSRGDVDIMTWRRVCFQVGGGGKKTHPERNPISPKSFLRCLYNVAEDAPAQERVGKDLTGEDLNSPDDITSGNG